MRRRSLAVAALLLASCSQSNPACDEEVASARTCIESFCDGNGSKLCDCVRAGKDVDISCGCADSLDDSFRGSLCDDQPASVPFDCAGARASFATVAGDYSCAQSCSTHSDCGSGVCYIGRCQDACTKDLECGYSSDGLICEEGKCIHGCRNDAGCDILNELCEDGMCVVKSCTQNYECRTACVGGKCT
jgi:hypothetical protein